VATSLLLPAVISMTRSRSEPAMSIPVRRLNDADTEDALSLYAELTAGPTVFVPEDFGTILGQGSAEVFGAQMADRIVATFTLHVLANVTWGGSPYALSENVVNAEAHLRKGIGKQVLVAAVEAA